MLALVLKNMKFGPDKMIKDRSITKGLVLDLRFGMFSMMNKCWKVEVLVLKV